MIICLTWIVAKINAREMLLYLKLYPYCNSNNLISSLIYSSVPFKTDKRIWQ